MFKVPADEFKMFKVLAARSSEYPPPTAWYRTHMFKLVNNCAIWHLKQTNNSLVCRHVFANKDYCPSLIRIAVVHFEDFGMENT